MGLTKIFDGALAPSSPISSAATEPTRELATNSGLTLKCRCNNGNNGNNDNNNIRAGVISDAGGGDDLPRTVALTSYSVQN